MECLHCGDCCQRISPSGKTPCPRLVQDGTFFFCGDYQNRYEECARHRFPYRFCPIGLEKLGLTAGDTTSIAMRIDTGWEKTKTLAQGGLCHG